MHNAGKKIQLNLLFVLGVKKRQKKISSMTKFITTTKKLYSVYRIIHHIKVKHKLLSIPYRKKAQSYNLNKKISADYFSEAKLANF